MSATGAAIAAIEYHLPAGAVSTEQLAAEFPEWPVEKMDAQMGIRVRHTAEEGECASDLAVEAAKKLFASGVCLPEHIDYVLFCTQTPDYFLPTTACVIQDRLGIPQFAGATDFDLGCSGFVVGLGLAKGLVETGQAANVLLLTGDTLSKLVNRRDRSVRPIFGDGAAATLVSAVEDRGSPWLGPFVYGTDGSGAKNLIVPAGGMRQPRSAETAVEREAESGNFRSLDNLFMNGAEIFNFALRRVPGCVHDLLEKAKLDQDSVDLFVLHQANQYMLEHLRKKLKIPPEKFVISMSHCGNTSSSSIPVALRDAQTAGRLKSGDVAMVIGFGVGYSWAGGLVRWR